MATSGRATMAVGRGTANPRSWDLAVERGPDWLFVRLESGSGEVNANSDLAEAIWGMIREHRANRIVLELDKIDAIDGPLIGAIAEIGTRVRQEGGLIRACGLSQRNLEQLGETSAGGVPHFGSRSEAVGNREVCSGLCE